MSYNQVMFLRRRGQWQAALDVALAYLHLLNDGWAHAALFWVVYDMAKLAIPMKGGEGVAAKCFVVMHSLLQTMQDDEQIGRKCYDRLFNSYMPKAALVMCCADWAKKQPGLSYLNVANREIFPQDIHPYFHNAYGWIIYYYLIHAHRRVSTYRVKMLLYRYLQMQTTRPSRLHSLILDFALDYASDHLRDFDLNRFLQLWGLEYLRRQDYFYQSNGYYSKSPIFDRLCREVERYNGVESVLTLLDESVIENRRSLASYLNRSPDREFIDDDYYEPSMWGDY